MNYDQASVNWLGGQTFGDSVERSCRVASRLLGLVWRSQLDGPHAKIASSQMKVFGDRNLRSASAMQEGGLQVAFGHGRSREGSWLRAFRM